MPQAAVNIPGGAVVQHVRNLGTGDGADPVVSTPLNNPYGPKISGLWVHNEEPFGAAANKMLVQSQGGAVVPAQEVHVWYSAFVERDTQGNGIPAGQPTFTWDASQGFVGGKLFLDGANTGNSCQNSSAVDVNYTMLPDDTCTAKNTAQLLVQDFVSTTPLLIVNAWPAMPGYGSALTGSDTYV